MKLQIYSKTMFLLALLLIILSSCINCFNEEEFDTIITVMNKNSNSGFYSSIFFVMNHYLYCKKNNKNFEINDEEWLFKSKDGWTDYFEKIELTNGNDKNNSNNVGHGTVMSDYSIQQYRDVIPEFYVYNENTKREINKIKSQYGLTDKNYDSIFIRRGDKLISESKKINDDIYIQLLLEKNPKCDTIFLQTDDYGSFVELEKYIKNNGLNIKLYTLCDKDNLGVVVFSHLKDQIADKKITKQKSVDEMNSDEIYKHTIDMIVGIDILTKSNICVTDYQSNVSRFIKIAHNNPQNVFDVLMPDQDIDYNKIVCPAHGF